MVDDLKGKRVLVTGGSRGLGRAMATAVAEAGADVAITGRDRDALAASSDAIRGFGVTCWQYELEVTDSAAVEDVVAQVYNDAGPVDVLFNNAGVNFFKPAVETTDEEWKRILDINLNGSFYVCRAVGRRMLEQGSGKIINIGSDLGVRGDVNWAAYSASKGGVITLSKTLAWEWAPTVTVNVIAPGAFYTDINRHMLDVPEIRQAVDAMTPLGRVGDPEELKPLAVFMAGPGSDFMTGSIVNIDGGIIKA